MSKDNKNARGKRPGITGAAAMSGGRTHAANQWRFTKSPESFTAAEKRLVFAEAVRIGISALFNLHLYSFANKTYLQKSGLPTGVRASCGLARLVGNSFDKELKKVLDKNKVVVDIGATVGWSHLAVKYYISGGCQILNMSGGCQILNKVMVVKY